MGMAGLICLRLPLILSIIGFTNQVGKLQMIWSDQKEPTARFRHWDLKDTKCQSIQMWFQFYQKT